MKRNMMKGTGRPAHAFKTLLAGAAMTAALGFAMNAQAGTPTCTVGNWATANALADADTGTQGTDNKRYGGPCGLRVAVDGTPRFLESPGLANESTYHVRFYAFLDDAGSGDIELFGTDAFSVMYEGGSGNVVLHADHAGGTDDSLAFPVTSGWYSVHVSWESDAAADVQFLVANRHSDVVADWQAVSLDTSGMGINAAHLGNVNGADTGGSIDFDDFVSTRITPPERLTVADATNDDPPAINISDVVAELAEVNEIEFAAGQPDCNEDGDINISDPVCTFAIINM